MDHDTVARHGGLREPPCIDCFTGAIATSLAIGTLSLCLAVALTVLSIKATIAMPIAG